MSITQACEGTSVKGTSGRTRASPMSGSELSDDAARPMGPRQKEPRPATDFDILSPKRLPHTTLQRVPRQPRDSSLPTRSSGKATIFLFLCFLLQSAPTTSLSPATLTSEAVSPHFRPSPRALSFPETPSFPSSRSTPIGALNQSPPLSLPGLV